LGKKARVCGGGGGKTCLFVFAGKGEERSLKVGAIGRAKKRGAPSLKKKKARKGEQKAVG